MGRSYTNQGDDQLNTLENKPLEECEILQQASNALPLILPWKPRKIRLGAPFDSRLLLTGDPFPNTVPFILSDLLMIPKRLHYEHGTVASYRSTETSRQCETEDHLSLGFGVSVGPPFLSDLASVSVKGQFEQSVVNNSDSNKASFRSSVRPARVQLDRNPRLTKEAMACIKYGGGYDAFCRQFGDYFVAGFRLGGETGILMSSSSSSHTKIDSYSIKASVKVLFVEGSKEWNKQDRRFSAFSSLKMMGYDTLSQRNWNSTTDEDGPALFRDQIEQVTLCSQSVSERTLKALEGWGMSDLDDLSDRQCEDLAASGAIVELFLLPMSQLRDVARWRNEKGII